MFRASSLSNAQVYTLAVAIILPIGLLDYGLGHDVPLFIAYLLPIAILALHQNLVAATAAAILCPFLSELADYLAGKPYDNLYLVAWVFCVRLIVLLLFVSMLGSVIRLLRRYRGYFDLGVVGMAVLSTGRKFLECNDRLAEILGHPREELFAGAWMDNVHPGDASKELALHNQMLAGAIDGYALDLRLQRADAGVVFASVSVKAARNPDGSISHFVAMVQDVTESRMLQESMIQNEKMMSLGRLTAGMAHEINNPLGGILQSSQVMLNRLTTSKPVNLAAAEKVGCPLEAIQDYLRERDIVRMTELIRDAASRAARIASGMLEFSRAGAAEAANDVRKLLDKAVELCSVDSGVLGYGFARIALERDYDPACPPLGCSATQLQQVFFNIVVNAVHALRDTPAPRIDLRVRSRDGRIVVAIEDNGSGMDETVRRRIFDPFFTTKGPDEGTGLGLYITWFIVTKNHGGTIDVDSAPGQGTRFTLSFPARDVPGAAQAR